MRSSSLLIIALVAIVALAGGTAWAQTTVTLPDTSQSTTLTADVSEQATVTVPTGVTFNVVDINSSTAADAASVTVTGIVLDSATKQLKISVQAAAASFTPSVESAITWAASDVSWAAASWTGGTGAAGTLASDAYNAVGTATADVAATSTTALVFTLAAKNTVKRSGDHTLSMTWKFESIAGA